MDDLKRPSGGRPGGNVKVYEKSPMNNIIAVVILAATILVAMVFVVNLVMSRSG